MKYLFALLSLIYCVISGQNINSNSTEFIAVPFLQTPPVIDGMEDENIKRLERKHFSIVEGNKEKESDAVNISYKLAYDAGFFYVLIEVESDSIVYRDRGYQNGDGLHLVIASPNKDGSASDEFYVLGFTPQKEGSKSWQKKFIWYRNVDISFRRLRDAQFEVNSSHGKTVYEILIPWREISPFHPWLSEAVGFNLCFVKASGENERTYYYVKYDAKIQSEGSPRKYNILKFEEPSLSAGVQLFADLNRRNIFEGDKAEMLIATAAANETNLKIYYKVISGEGALFGQSSKIIDPGNGLAVKRIPLNLSRLIPGGYKLEILGAKGEPITELPFTVLPNFDYPQASEKLNEIKLNISAGSYFTLLFKLNEINAGFKKLKPYETAASLRVKLHRFNKIIAAAKQGTDELKIKKGIFRRAYLSEVDSTLQPYSVKIPRDYNPAKKYPLIVFLHGSGQDDRGVLYQRKGISEEFIELAPSGRGTSNVYSKDFAQDDIRESINDVIKNYSIDATKIILSGFSMGGYGVYRTFYETPERFAALSVFSGHPNLANKWGIGENEPNFLDEKYLSDFSGKKIFIFHGGRDRNCPIELTKELVVLLEKNGAEVNFAFEKEKGHERAGAETMSKYDEWLKEIINTEK